MGVVVIALIILGLHSSTAGSAPTGDGGEQGTVLASDDVLASLTETVDPAAVDMDRFGPS